MQIYEFLNIAPPLISICDKTHSERLKPWMEKFLMISFKKESFTKFVTDTDLKK